MPSTGSNIRETIAVLLLTGLHRGPRFADHATGALSIEAAAFRAVTGKTPRAFTTDDDLSLLLITTNEQAMDVIRAISNALPTEPPTDGIEPGGTPNHIEHLAGYADPAGEGRTPPTESEVIGVIHRAAQHADALTTV